MNLNLRLLFFLTLGATIAAFAMDRKEAIRVLELDPGKKITEGDVSKAFRKLSRSRHPNRGGTEKEFILLTEARDSFVNPTFLERDPRNATRTKKGTPTAKMRPTARPTAKPTARPRYYQPPVRAPTQEDIFGWVLLALGIIGCIVFL